MPPRPRAARPGPSPSQVGVDALAYSVMAYIPLVACAMGMVAGRAALLVALATAVVCAAAAAAAAAARLGAPGSVATIAYARARPTLAVALRVTYTSAQNLVVTHNASPSRPPRWVTWPVFFAGRTGPWLMLAHNLAAGLDRPALLALLACEVGAAAATQAPACARLVAAWPVSGFYFNRMADVLTTWAGLAVGAAIGGGGGSGGGGGGGLGGPGPPSPASHQATAAAPAAHTLLDACALHACRAVQGHLYLLAAALAYVLVFPPAGGNEGSVGVGVGDRLARRPRERRWASTAAARAEAALLACLGVVGVALAAWGAISVLLPRPAGCAGAAAEAAWPEVVALRAAAAVARGGWRQ